MGHTLKAVVILTIIFLVSIATITFATQDRRPVDGPTPPVPTEPECPTTFIDTACTAYGQATNAVFAWALSQAGYSCDDKMSRCYNSEAAELADNKVICEAVPGCKLTYTDTYDECELGGSANCTPAPDVDPNPASFTCTIRGEYNITGYSCTRPLKPVATTSTI